MTTQAAPDILAPEHVDNPWRTFRALLQDYPVLYHAPTQSWLISRHEDVSHLFRTKDVSSENYVWQLEPVHGRTILQMEGKEHTKHRSLLLPFFHGLGLESFTPTIEGAARSLIENWLPAELEAVSSGRKARGEVDLVNSFTRHFPVTVIERMLDLPHEDHSHFERWYVSIMDFLSNLTGDPVVAEKGLRTREELADYMLPKIAERRTSDADDLLSRLCRAEFEGEQLSDDEIRAFTSLLLVAGGETTDRALANLFMNLIDNPDQLAAVYEDRSLVDAAFAESLRHTPPVHMIMRQSEIDLEIQGVKIPAGSTLTLLLAAANRDPRKFEDPDRFDIFRSDNDVRRAFTAGADHCSLANGRHFCVGAMLAATEVRIATNMLLDCMQDVRYAEGFSPVPEGVFTNAPNRMDLTFVPA